MSTTYEIRRYGDQWIVGRYERSRVAKMVLWNPLDSFDSEDEAKSSFDQIVPKEI